LTIRPRDWVAELRRADAARAAGIRKEYLEMPGHTAKGWTRVEADARNDG
jgi:hypothetical protein